MELPVTAALTAAFQRLFGDRSEAEVIAAVLLEYIRSNDANLFAALGVFFTDSESSWLSRSMQSEVIPLIQAAGVTVAFCNLEEADIGNAASLVHNAMALAGITSPAGRGTVELSFRRRAGRYSVDEGHREGTARMILAALDDNKSDVVVVINVVERLLSTIEGRSLLAGMQDACELSKSREANRFLLVGIGTDDAILDRLTMGSFKPARGRLTK